MTTRAAQTLADFTASGPKKSKYRNQPITVDGIRFASLKESRRFAELQLLERAGKIADLKAHPAWPLDVNGYPVGRYTADASYRVNGELIVEDVKSPATRKTDGYVLRRKLMRAIHGIEVQEV